MAKKSRRNKQRKIRLSAAQLEQPGGAESAEPMAAVAAAEAPNLRKEYGSVFVDLKRLGIIAAAALVVVVVLVLILA